MTLSVIVLGWFATSLLLGAAWTATASTRRQAMDTVYPLAAEQPAQRGGGTRYVSDAVTS